MIFETSPVAQAQWQEQVRQYLIQENYTRAASLCEQAIAAEPDVKSHYWYLGLILLLQGQEAEAHTTWLLGMVDGEAEQVELWTEELRQVLEAEAQRREGMGEYSVAWLIRQHQREICPRDINNLLHLIQLGVELETFTGDELNEWGVKQLLQEDTPADIDPDLLLQALQRILDWVPAHPASLEFVEASITHVRNSLDFIKVVLPAAISIAYSQRQPGLGVSLAELCLRVDNNNLEVLRHLACFYQNAEQYDKGIETAKLCYSLSQELVDKIYANQLIIRGLMSAGGYWEESASVFERQELMLKSLIEAPPKNLLKYQITRLINSYFFAPYFQDEPKHQRAIFNQLSKLIQIYIENSEKGKVEKYRQKNIHKKNLGKTPKTLKIGYLSYCLRMHSVGWLARGVFQYHNREKFQIYAYLVRHKRQVNDPIEEWYISQVSQAYISEESGEIAEQIYRDEIDILVDLDSITIDSSCEVMAMKPAPVQVTWLGWDASGIPAVDYFIADPYVLPEDAQNYYQETIWRLPDTYIAVDGFEVAVPNLRRELLDIPSDAVVYLSSQKGYKRHPDTVRLQMKIIKEVPNSYFLIKGTADAKSIKNFFTKLAEEEGVDGERLRFLPDVATEAVHRANLGIADVVLDTYPYNGATTTMETLWMGIPLVTRVGEQFAARNSYTMMMNVGVKEGIAWSAEEYVEWGIRLGKDAELRKQISWQLRQSRHTSPLWNARKFTREIEKAYEQMWQRYLENKS